MRGSATDGARARSDRALFRRLRDPDDPLDSPQLVERFLPLARSVARAHVYGSETFDDVFQVACVGLVKAVDRFDVDRRIAFSSYAVPTMSGEIKRYYRDRTWAVRPPRAVQELALRADREIECWRAHHGHAPSVDELAEALDTAAEEVLEALQAHSTRRAASLDVPVGRGEEGHSTLGDLLGAADPRFVAVERGAVIDGLLVALPPRDRMIVRMRFQCDMTQAEIGRACGLSQMQISRVLRISLDRMRDAAAGRDAEGLRMSGGHVG